MSHPRSFAAALTFTCGLLQGAPSEPILVPESPSPWVVAWKAAALPQLADTSLRPLRGPMRHLADPGEAASAVVEVWGEGPRETLRLTLQRLSPELQVAFQVGLDCDTSAQMLREFMATPGDVHAPTSPMVYYNCLRPSETAWH